jgi:threonylcarbamoyladenosine tRNA methylthiotransferase MtaB
MEQASPGTAAVYVLGCKVNQAEAAAMAQALRDAGYRVERNAADPDLIVVNTCCVTSRAEGKSRRMVKRLAELHPDAEFMITGCLAEVNASAFDALLADHRVLGTLEKDRFREYLGRRWDAGEGLRAERATAFGDLGPAAIQDRARPFLKVQDGCSQGCSYCIVPRARGPSRSLEPGKVVEYARATELPGVAEIVLSGVHLGMYGRDLTPKLRLEDLLEMLLDACPKIRFRLSSVEPQEITPGLIELVGRGRGACRHFHLPLQSGDDEILKRMGRPYDAALIEALVGAMRESSPDICIGMDVMVGFPGETDDSFLRTRYLLERLRPAYLHVFPFSPRPGTRASSFTPRVADSTARGRVKELRALSDRLRLAFYRRFVGKALTVVPERRSDPDGETIPARSDNYILIRVPRSLMPAEKNSFRVRVEKIVGTDAWGGRVRTDSATG